MTSIEPVNLGVLVGVATLAFVVAFLANKPFRALLIVPLVLALWLIFFRSAYWIAHGVPAGHLSPAPAEASKAVGPDAIEYVALDYVLLAGSLCAAVWTVSRLTERDEP